MNAPEDVAAVIELFRMNYDRARARDERHAKRREEADSRGDYVPRERFWAVRDGVADDAGQRRRGQDAARHLTNGDTEPRLAGLTTKGRTRTMKITDADHTNWRVKDVERSLAFYRDVLGLEPFGLDEYERGEHPLVSLRITPEFILHLRPDPTFEAVSTGGYDHLALMVEGTNLDALAEHLTDAGVEIERTSENVVGARGPGEALYVRDPDGYLIELKLYTNESGAPPVE
jgi:catechol 2,3-dioxygenase-like lactoylglutathione lyase family enzyme